ncbi:Aspartate racemase [Acidisarcina polymorpha]|uniref:Aspartate racemase n=1 Tax=Acidisarcina polymorpha TaxID=2211140 RepID=A0A2Z5FZK7_9BACT|nr:aspartate/glutamate racemase family protein [Acidisarcina polymorpha]AXC12160.1 Aspartate racemase [Acidisarcina polymorpha]
MVNKTVPPTFGLVAGLGVGAGIFYYRSLVKALLADGISPRILMVHADVKRVMAHAQARETHALATYLRDLLQQLADGGVQVATIPAFSPQICAQELANLTPLPLIDLLDAIVAEVNRLNWMRLAIFGARVTIETRLFGRLEAIEVVDLDPAELDAVSTIYSCIVENERASAEEESTLQTLAHSLIARHRLDGILLAGTDLSFVFTPERTSFSHIDGARVHIDAIHKSLIAYPVP